MCLSVKNFSSQDFAAQTSRQVLEVAVGETEAFERRKPRRLGKKEKSKSDIMEYFFKDI
jgi:hypothetical protein